MIHKDFQGNVWDCQIKEALKDIPTIKSDLPISAYGSIDLDELNKTVERLNKIPNYDDLMKENNKLQSNWNSLREWLIDLDLADVYAREVVDKMNELRREEYEMTDYVYVARDMIIKILSNHEKPTVESIHELFEIQTGSTEVLLKHLISIRNIFSKAIEELEGKDIK